VANDEPALVEVIEKVCSLADVVTWAIDLHGSESALLVALLLDRGPSPGPGPAAGCAALPSPFAVPVYPPVTPFAAWKASSASPGVS
jgi:hypothetical protein